MFVFPLKSKHTFTTLDFLTSTPGNILATEYPIFFPKENKQDGARLLL